MPADERLEQGRPGGSAISETIVAALAKDAEVTEVEHAVLPVNFACPNLIRIGADGTREGITDAMSPWSAALAQ